MISAVTSSSRTRSQPTDWFLVGLWLSLVLLAIIWISPFIFIVFTSLKSASQILGGHIFIPPLHPAWSNYQSAWEKGNFSSTFFNSVVIAVVKVPLGILISAALAYAISQIRWRFMNAIFFVLLCGTMIPFQVLIAPLFTIVNSLHLTNTYVGVILPYIAFGTPYQVFVLRAFFSQIPAEMREAALIDGASELKLFWKVFLPLSIPVISALIILDFIATWNEFAMALVILQDQGHWTLPLGLMGFQGQFSSAYGPLNAAIVMTAVPAVIVYLIFQRYFVSGMMAGAVKE